MSEQDFLVEIGTEELPPKALGALSKAFENNMKTGLEQACLSFSAIHSYATPRRLAVMVSELLGEQPEKKIEPLTLRSMLMAIQLSRHWALPAPAESKYLSSPGPARVV